MDKTTNTHFTEAHMDRRLKIYRDSNPADNAVQDFFSKSLLHVNGESMHLSDHFKTVHAISSSDME